MRFTFFKNNYKWYFPTFIIICVVLGVISSFFVYQIVDKAGRDSLIFRAETIGHALNIADVESLSGTEADIGTPVYESLKQKLISIREANPDTQFVYIVGKRAGEVFFYVDSEPSDSEDYSPPGEIYYEESEAFDKAFDGFDATEGPVKDRWGVWISSAAPLKNLSTGQVVGVVGIDVDATSYVRNNLVYASIPLLLAFLFALFGYVGLRIRKDEEKLIELKSQFVAIASHELRSPLTGIRWVLSSLIKAQDINPLHKEELHKIENSTKRLVSTVNDILKAASLETQNNQLELASKNLYELIHAVTNENIPVANAKDIQLTFFNEIPKDAFVKADESMLFEAFSNIVSNAIKYSKEHSKVEISYKLHEGKHCIEVKDAGIGIPANEIKKVFDGFFRAHNAKKTTTNGSGLGLYFVKKIIEAHKGTIDLSSEEGVGTTVSICLPKAPKI